MTNEPVIVALDLDSPREADALVAALGDSAGFYKVGMELFAAAGMDYVRCLTDRGKRVFLDLKYYDIGETVRRAVALVARSGYECTIGKLVAKRVRQAMAAGIDGVVASPLEACAIRQAAGPDAILATPGVRSRGAAQGDQKRVATPVEAIRGGADYMVIGRQVTRAADPAAALGSIRDELREAWNS